MKYATWKLNFINPEYGTGPEPEIVANGGTAEGAWVDGDITDGGTVLGYFTGDAADLAPWEFAEVSQEQALEFAKAIDPTAYLLEDGRIGAVRQEIY
jgi:hypothetical protein